MCFPPRFVPIPFFQHLIVFRLSSVLVCQTHLQVLSRRAGPTGSNSTCSCAKLRQSPVRHLLPVLQALLPHSQRQLPVHVCVTRNGHSSGPLSKNLNIRPDRPVTNAPRLQPKDLHLHPQIFASKPPFNIGHGHLQAPPDIPEYPPILLRHRLP